MMRRGDGIGIEVLPDALRGVRLQQDAPGRVAKVAGVACDTNNDLLLLDGLTRLRSLLDEAGQPTRVCMWRHDSYIQSLDVTGWSTTELNLHRSKLIDVSATIEMSSSARRLLAHLRTDMIRHRRVERFVRQAGFDLESIEPTPIAIARLVPSYTMRLIGSRGDAQPWMAVVHDHLVLAAAPVAEPRARHAAEPSCWPPVGRRRSKTCASDCSIPAHLAETVNQPAGMAVSLGSEPCRRRVPRVPGHASGVGSTTCGRARMQPLPQPASRDVFTRCSHWWRRTRSATTEACG